MVERLTYKKAGVDIAAADQAVQLIKARLRSTYGTSVIGDVGSFASLFSLGDIKLDEPVLVASTDGVGTKSLVAQATGRLDSIGIDLVAMCVDDVVCQGAKPLFMLDYLAVGKVNPKHIEDLVGGIAHGCRIAGCALVGGEIAEQSEVYGENGFDLAGFVVGVVERARILGPEKVRPFDVLVGLHSPGLRSNGYTLARRVFLSGENEQERLNSPAWQGSTRSLADELLEPSVIYAPTVLLAAATDGLHAVAHITGGGIPSNLSRVLPESCDAVVNRSSWEPPGIFRAIQLEGGVEEDEMWNVFNMGVGMVLVVDGQSLDSVIDVVRDAKLGASVIGEIVPGTGRVRWADG